jgi:hypothetical protein
MAMTKFLLKDNTGEVINTVFAEDIYSAQVIFADRKQIDVNSLIDIFEVVEEKRQII